MQITLLVNMDRETGDIYVYAIKEVVDEVYDPALEISLGKAKAIDQNLNLGDTVRIEITPKGFRTYCSNACKKRYCAENQRRRKRSCI